MTYVIIIGIVALGVTSWLIDDKDYRDWKNDQNK